MSSTNRKAIVLRLDRLDVSDVDAVCDCLNMSRSRWLRKAVRCQLEHAHVYELPLLKDPAIRSALK